MSYVKRKVCSKAGVTILNFDEIIANFLCDIEAIAIVEIKAIPPALILNCDHTSLKYVLSSSSSWTMAKEGSKWVDIAGIIDKRLITAVLIVTLDGNLYPFS